MTCAKIRVFATLTSPTGEQFVGENACNNPQPSCPREPGEGYEKCGSICEQDGHAEIDAIGKARAAGYRMFGGWRMHVTHKRICDHCSSVLVRQGIIATHE